MLSRKLLLLDIRTTTYHFFVIVCLVVQLKAFDWERVTWFCHNRNQGKKLTRRDAITFAALVSNVDVKNMGNCENCNKKLMFL